MADNQANHSRFIVHKRLQRHFDEHRDKFDKHRKKGPAFAAALAALERKLFK